MEDGDGVIVGVDDAKAVDEAAGLDELITAEAYEDADSDELITLDEATTGNR